MNNLDKAKLSKALTTVGLTTGRNVDHETVSAFAMVLDDYPIYDIERAIMAHMKDSSVFRPFPTPQDIIKRMEPDFDGAFDRMIRRCPTGEIEVATSSSVGFSCRGQLYEKEARVKYKKEYLRQVELSKMPRTPPSHQIEHEKPVNIKDQMVDADLHKYKGMSMEEKKAMLANFKLNKVKK